MTWNMRCSKAINWGFCNVCAYLLDNIFNHASEIRNWIQEAHDTYLWCPKNLQDSASTSGERLRN